MGPYPFVGDALRVGPAEEVLKLPSPLVERPSMPSPNDVFSGAGAWPLGLSGVRPAMENFDGGNGLLAALGEIFRFGLVRLRRRPGEDESARGELLAWRLPLLLIWPGSGAVVCPGFLRHRSIHKTAMEETIYLAVDGRAKRSTYAGTRKTQARRQFDYCAGHHCCRLLRCRWSDLTWTEYPCALTTTSCWSKEVSRAEVETKQLLL